MLLVIYKILLTSCQKIKIWLGNLVIDLNGAVAIITYQYVLNVNRTKEGMYP